MTLEAARRELAALCDLIVERGLEGPLASGNASTRVADNLVVTPSALPFSELAEHTLVPVELSTRAVLGEGTPTSELALHCAVHGAAGERGRFVAHLHAPWVVAASCLALAELPLLHYHQALLGPRATPFVPYSTPGSEELARAAAVAVRDETTALVLANHGGLVLGTTVAEVIARGEVLEDVCRLAVLTRGAARELGVHDLARARDLFASYGAR